MTDTPHDAPNRLELGSTPNDPPEEETGGTGGEAPPSVPPGSQGTPQSQETPDRPASPDGTDNGVVQGPEPPPPGTIISPKGEVYTPAPRPAIVEREKPKRTKRKGGETAPKPGKPSWIWGTKLKFFDARKDTWVKAHERKTTGEFYLKMAKLYTVKYGFELEDNEDFEVDVEDPPDWVADTVVNVRLSAEETTKRQEYHTKLREVECLSFTGGNMQADKRRQRLGQWYRAKNAGVLKAEKTSFGELFSGLGHLQAKPRRPQLHHFYLSRHYNTRIKARVKARTETLQKRAEYSGEELPAAITIQNEVTKECWEEESNVFQEETRRALEHKYEITLKGWKESLADSPARTPEEYNT
jgi:hypothetical protein